MAFSCLTLQISQYEKQKQDAFGQLEEVSVIDIIQSVLYTVEQTRNGVLQIKVIADMACTGLCS